MIKYFFPLLLITLICSSCGRKYKVTGTSSVNSLDGKMLFLKFYEDDEWNVVDSVEVVHGEFSMKGKVDSVCLVTLFMDDVNILPLVLEKGKITISISNNDLRVKGTPLNDRLYSFFDQRAYLEEKMEESNRKESRLIMDGGNIDEIERQMKQEREKINEEINQYVKNFISENYENVLGPAIFVMLCSNFRYPIVTPQIEEIVSGAPSVFQNNQFVKEYMEKARENMEILERQQSASFDY
ncbi:MAG: DUF4369 domain-containing protein [Bacteroides sp.]|nr:DUF4369 domain-containing protein [Bacteroides sp.]